MDRVLRSQSGVLTTAVSFHYENYVRAARPRTEESQEVYIVWAALSSLARHFPSLPILEVQDASEVFVQTEWSQGRPLITAAELTGVYTSTRA